MIRLLVVDDERLVRRGIMESIPWKEHGIEVVGEAVNGREALDLIPMVRPDIVLADIRMPLMDGLDLADAVPRPRVFPRRATDDFRALPGGTSVG